MVGICIYPVRLKISAETGNALDRTEQVDHLVQIVPAEIERESSAVVEREEEKPRLEIEKRSIRRVMRRALRVDRYRLADDPVVEIFSSGLLPRAEERIGRGGEDDVILFREAHQLGRFCEGRSHHLFAVDVLAVLHRLGRDDKMRFGIGEVDDDLDLGVVHHFLGRHLLHAVFVRDVLSARVDQIGAPDDVDDVETVHHDVHVRAAAYPAAPHDADLYSSVVCHTGPPLLSPPEGTFYRLYDIIPRRRTQSF